MVRPNVSMIDLGTSVGILYCINKEDFLSQKAPLLHFDPAYRQISQSPSRVSSKAGRIWSDLSDRASEVTGTAAAIGTAYLVLSNLTFRIQNPSDLLAAGAITVLIPLLTGAITYNSTQSAMEYCGDVASRAYQAIAGIFDIDNYL